MLEVSQVALKTNTEYGQRICAQAIPSISSSKAADRRRNSAEEQRKSLKNIFELEKPDDDVLGIPKDFSNTFDRISSGSRREVLLRNAIQDAFLSYSSPQTSPTRFRDFMSYNCPNLTRSDRSENFPTASKRRDYTADVDDDQKFGVTINTVGNTSEDALKRNSQLKIDNAKLLVSGTLELRENLHSKTGMKLELTLNKSRLILTKLAAKQNKEMGNFRLEDTIVGVFQDFPCLFVITTEERHLKALRNENVGCKGADCLHFYCKHESIRDEWVEIMKGRGAQIFRESSKRSLPPI
mmetsp:Transcript_13278/g.30549  ORF Transcript_13278/g.30549 Transcript_13278/m.30549 type:complete len:296 (-) Transcript_13278:222-1109(-)|eukprot:747684-Hanusia_phi.AAC.3